MMRPSDICWLQSNGCWMRMTSGRVDNFFWASTNNVDVHELLWSDGVRGCSSLEEAVKETTEFCKRHKDLFVNTDPLSPKEIEALEAKVKAKNKTMQLLKD